MASVTLTISQQYAGNNYVVQTCLKSNFTGPVPQTTTLTAWKRVYLEVDRMYQSGATIVTTHAPDKVSMEFCNYWFENRGQDNVFQLVAAHKHQDNSLGTTDFDANISFVTIDNHPDSVKAAAVLTFRL